MADEHSREVADAATKIYEERLRSALEQSDLNKFVAIEPQSGDHFIAESFGVAVAKSRAVHPNRIAFVIRVGHEAAIHIGACSY